MYLSLCVSLVRSKHAAGALTLCWTLACDEVCLSTALCRDLTAKCTLKLAQQSACAVPGTAHRQMSSCNSSQQREVKQG